MPGLSTLVAQAGTSRTRRRRSPRTALRARRLPTWARSPRGRSVRRPGSPRSGPSSRRRPPARRDGR